MEDKTLSEKESLKLITEMIHTAKSSFHESGNSAILWGCVVAFCSFVSFAARYWSFAIGFDIWILTLVAIVPQIFISIRESKRRKFYSHTERTIGIIWTIYAVSIFALAFYWNVVPGITDKFFAEDGIKLTMTYPDGSVKPLKFFIPSQMSIIMVLYAIPTLATGLIVRFTPMIIGAMICYALFIVTCFTPVTYDMLLSGFAALCNWLIPGLILKFGVRSKQVANV